ncbi:MAG: hypothetical protein HOW73_22710 [Polyangiaceae bacterium]|nr:hypothetical protein [Polyangiaceae bacterium]
MRLGDSAAEVPGADASKREVSFQIDGGLVSRIYLARECFADIQWRTPEDVVASLGAPDVLERANRTSRLTFPNLSLIVFLNHETREVHATIMAVPRVGPRRYTVRDLLNELICAPWLCDTDTPENRTARARRKRAEILASELGLDLHEIATGAFLDKRDKPTPDFHALLRRHAGEYGDRLICHERHAFVHLWTFRCNATQVVTHNGCFLEASGEYAGLLHLTHTRGVLDPILDEVDQALCLLLDPEKRSIDESRLLERGWITDTILHEWEIEDW